MIVAEGGVMLTRYARAAARRVLTPLARWLLRIGIGPDLVTFLGTLGVCVGALAFYPRGSFFPGSVVITLFVLLDTVDGTMARLTGRRSSWGAFLDSTLDRVADGAIFGGLALWYAGTGDDIILCAVAIYCLVSGAVVPYAKARAESLGMTADVGIAERADRLTLILVCTGLSGLGVPYLREAGLWLLAVAATVTVVQRMVVVRRQAMAQQAAP
jgi:CDP-diacylglycerol---glycerol-3-phosphate 3-phosphatidyltransferase